MYSEVALRCNRDLQNNQWVIHGPLAVVDEDISAEEANHTLS